MPTSSVIGRQTGRPSADQLVTNVVCYSEKLRRNLRQDPAAQLGVPSQDLALVAVDRGAKQDALVLARYMFDEFKIISDTVLNGWLAQLVEYAIPRLGAEKAELVLRVPRKHVWDALLTLAERFNSEAVQAIAKDDRAAAEIGLEHTRHTLKLINDETVRFIQDILTALADAYGEDEPERALRGPYEVIWRERYKSWETLTALEQLQLSCEGMRGHFGGPTRRGEFDVIEEADRYRMVFGPCGTGGVLRHGDPETGEPPWNTHGVNKEPKPYTWGEVGVPWYCTHCSLYLEHWAAEDRGYPIRPVVWVEDPVSPITTVWLIYKDGRRPRAEDYERIGRIAPATAAR
jgi:hypothetical protein